MSDVLIVGAGLAGLTAAAELRAAGRSVTLVDKGRRPGGRAAQREVAGVGTFEHGLPWVGPEAEDGAFDGFAPWRDGRRVAPGGAGAWTAALAAPLDLRQEVRAERIAGGPGAWRVEAGEALEAAHLILTVPPAQAAALLPAAADALRGVETIPCWTLMAAFEAPTGIDPARAAPGDRAIPEHAKPGRAAAPERWTFQLGAEASAEMLETDREAALAPLTERLAALADGPLPPPIHVRAHRWRYAACARPLGAEFAEAEGALLGGDWAPERPRGPSGGLEGGAAAAVRSGRAMAAALLAR